MKKYISVKKILLFVCAISYIFILIFKFDLIKKNVDSIDFFIKEDTITVGNILDLQYEIEPKSAKFDNLTIKFNDESLIRQNNNGDYVAIKDGILKATIVCDDKSYDMKIINIKAIEVDTIIINDFVLGIGREYSPEISIYPYDSTHKDYIITSDDTSIAKVLNNKVIAVSEGITKIKVKSVDGPIGECFINVYEIVPDNIKIINSKSSIEVNDEIQLNITYTPYDVTNKKIEWYSSNSNILEVDKNGLVVAKDAGKAIITAKYSNDTLDCTEIIVTYPPITSISISANSKNIYVGSTLQLRVNYTPNKVIDDTIKWKSYDSKIASVDENGVVTGISAGIVNIAAISANDKISLIKLTIDEKPIITKSSEVLETVRPNTNSQEEMVWLSATGTKYHSINNCGRMNPDKATHVTLKYAKEHGFEPCSNCH